MTSIPKAMKGYELYSWNAQGTWWFALLVGTNRLKSIDEITVPGVAIKSADELRSHLAQLAQGEEIVWMTWTDDRLALPPQPVIEAVERMCQELDLELTVAP